MPTIVYPPLPAILEHDRVAANSVLGTHLVGQPRRRFIDMSRVQCKPASTTSATRQARGPADHKPYMTMKSLGFETHQQLLNDLQRRALRGHSIKTPRPFIADVVDAKMQVSK